MSGFLLSEKGVTNMQSEKDKVWCWTRIRVTNVNSQTFICIKYWHINIFPSSVYWEGLETMTLSNNEHNLCLNIFPLLEGTINGSLEKYMTLGLRQRNRSLVTSKSKEVLKEWWGHIKKNMGQFEGTPTDQVWNNFSIKINNESYRL